MHGQNNIKIGLFQFVICLQFASHTRAQVGGPPVSGALWRDAPLRKAPSCTVVPFPLRYLIKKPHPIA